MTKDEIAALTDEQLTNSAVISEATIRIARRHRSNRRPIEGIWIAREMERRGLKTA